MSKVCLKGIKENGFNRGKRSWGIIKKDKKINAEDIYRQMRRVTNAMEITQLTTEKERRS